MTGVRGGLNRRFESTDFTQPVASENEVKTRRMPNGNMVCGAVC